MVRSRFQLFLPWMAVLLLTASAAARLEADPLPSGALAQLGEARILNFGRIMALAFSPDSRMLAAGSWDGELRLYDISTHKEVRRFAGHDGVIKSLGFTNDGKLLLSAGEDGSVRLWDAATGQESRRLQEPGGQTHSVAVFSSDGKTVATWRARMRPKDRLAIAFWDAASWKQVGTLTLEGIATPLRFPADDRLFAMLHWPWPVGPDTHPTIRFWDWTAGKEKEPSIPAPRAFAMVAFSPDGRILALGSYQGLRLWDLGAGKDLRPFEPEERLPRKWEAFRQLVFSVDSKTLISAGGQNVIHVWETATSQERCRFQSPIGGEVCVAVSPNGRYLASSGVDTTVLLWDLTGLGTLPPAGEKFQPAELDKLWQDLESPSAQDAYRAIWRLATDGAASAAYARGKLKPAAATDPDRIAKLLSDVDHPSREVRERVSRELESLHERAVPYLRKELVQRSPSLEYRRRLERILERASEMTSTQLRELRAIEMLERSNTPEARSVLQSLAQGAPEARLTQEAKTALERSVREARP
jgi:hypothetical protein